MKPKTSLALSAVVLAVLIGVAVYFEKRASQAKATADTLATQTIRLQNEADRLEKSIAATNQGRARSSAPITARQASRDAAGQKPDTQLDFRALMNSPKMQEMRLAQQRARLGLAYGRLFHDLGLSPDQIAKFDGIMAEHDAQLSDIRATAVSQGLDRSDPAIRALRQQADQQLQAAEAALLGDSGYQQAQEYNRTLPARTLVDGLAGAVAFTTPLTAQQAELMTQALANASRSYQGGGTADMANVDYERVDQAAQGILSASQLAAWQQDPGRSQVQLASALESVVSEALRAPGKVRADP